MRSVLTAALFALPLFHCAVVSQEAVQTNIIFLLVDDWGWRDAGCFGSDLYQTPNMDQLAREGVRFTNAYAACTVCSPTRAAAMTGFYPARSRVTDWIPGHVRRNAKLSPPDWTQRLEHRHETIAEVLKKAGYRTAHVGKWHLTPRSADLAEVKPYDPEQHGFQVNIAGNQWGAPGSYHWPFARKKGEGLGRRLRNFPKGGAAGEYLTDMLTRHAIQFIADCKQRPFFLYLPYYAVHTPIQGRADLTKRYRELLASESGRQHTQAAYAAMVSAVDESLGRIRQALREQGIEKNTVILLTGDNGGLDRKGRPTDNAPLRAGKGSAYEGGVRVPCIIYAPGRCKAGAVSDEPVTTVDFYPTIQAMTGTKGEAAHNAQLDGKDLSTLLGDPEQRLQRDAIYWHYPHYHPGGARPYSALRMRDWKLIEFQEDGRVELYHLSEDIGEQHDLARAQPQRAKRMQARLHSWRRSQAAQMAVANPRFKAGK